MKRLYLALAALLVSVHAYAQTSIAGKWSGESKGRQGTMKTELELKLTGGKLGGTMSMGPMGKSEIKDGTVSGSKMSFVTAVNARGINISIKYSGEVKGDELILNREISGLPPGLGRAGSPQPVIFKRTK